MNVYDVGDAIKLYTVGPFTDPDSGTPFDPATVRFKVRVPAGTVTTLTYGTDPEVSNPSPGEYAVIFRPTVPGTYYWRVEGLDGEGQALSAEESQFEVTTPRVS